MVEWMKEAELPEPEYKEGKGGFSVYFYKDAYTEENLRKMGLNERQIKAVGYVKEKGKITNKEYQKLSDVSKPTATREFSKLVDMGLLNQQGITGKGTFYTLIKGSQRAQMAHKGLAKGSNNQSSQKDTTKITLHYYCKVPGDKEIKALLKEINERYGIGYEVIEGPYDREKDKQVYEKYFKPRAKILKKKTGRPITKLRSRKAGNYFVSIPGTLAVFRNSLVEWWCFTNTEIISFLGKILSKGLPFLEELLGE